MMPWRAFMVGALQYSLLEADVSPACGCENETPHRRSANSKGTSIDQMGTCSCCSLLAYSAAVMSMGRRQPRPASIGVGDSPGDSRRGVTTARSYPQRVDRVVHLVGAGRLLVHLAFMTVLCGPLSPSLWRPRAGRGVSNWR